MTNPGRSGEQEPMSKQCGIFICVSHSESGGLQCAKCLQSECIDQLISYWGNLHRNHRILSQPTIARDIIEYMFGNGLAAYCSCGTCNPDWFLHGWICRPDAPWPWAVPDRNHLAWRRLTHTPMGKWPNMSDLPAVVKDLDKFTSSLASTTAAGRVDPLCTATRKMLKQLFTTPS